MFLKLRINLLLFAKILHLRLYLRSLRTILVIRRFTVFLWGIDVLISLIEGRLIRTGTHLPFFDSTLLKWATFFLDKIRHLTFVNRLTIFRIVLMHREWRYPAVRAKRYYIGLRVLLINIAKS